MNTRKSAPLPNPNDSLNQYRINYEMHYQNFHKYLMGRIQKEKHARNLLIKEFNREAKIMNRLEENSSENDQNQHEIKEVKQKMEKIYSQICAHELEVHKLLQEDQGVIMQLCELLDNKGNEIKNYRSTSSSKHCTLTFLHLVSNVIKTFDDSNQDVTLSMDEQDENANFIHKNANTSNELPEDRVELEKEDEKPSNFSEHELRCHHSELSPAEDVKCDKDIETECTVHNQIKQIKQVDEREIKEKETQNASYFNSILIKNTPTSKEIKNTPTETECTSFKEKIESIINEYKKSDQSTNSVMKTKTEETNYIELNSSTDDLPTQKDSFNGHIKNRPPYQDNSKKNRLKQKKVLKSCITILD